MAPLRRWAPLRRCAPLRVLHRPVDGCTFSTATMGLGGAAAPIVDVPNLIAHPSTVSVAISVLLYNGRLLCGFNVP